MVQKLRDEFGGVLLQPGDDGYDAARSVWNGAIDRRPAVIARCHSPADVAAALAFAQRTGARDRRARRRAQLRRGGACPTTV